MATQVLSHFSRLPNVRITSFLMFVALLILAILSNSEALECSQDDLEGIKECYKPFMAFFNISIENGLPDYWTFHMERRRRMLTEGKQIVEPMCKVANDLFPCVSEFPCLKKEVFDQITVANASVTSKYVNDLAVMKYHCGEGISIFRRDLECVFPSWERSLKTTIPAECFPKYPEDVAVHGECKAQQLLVNCMYSFTQKNCGWNGGVFVCNSVVRIFNVYDSSCYDQGAIHCPKERDEL